MPSSLIQVSAADENPGGGWMGLDVYLGRPKLELATASPKMITRIVRLFVFMNGTPSIYLHLTSGLFKDGSYMIKDARNVRMKWRGVH